MVTKNLKFGYKCIAFGLALVFLNCAYAQSSLDRLKNKNAQATERNQEREKNGSDSAAYASNVELKPNPRRQTFGDYSNAYKDYENKQLTAKHKGKHIDAYVLEYSPPLGNYTKQDGGQILSWEHSVVVGHSRDGAWNLVSNYGTCKTKVVTDAKSLITIVEKSYNCYVYDINSKWKAAK